MNPDEHAPQGATLPDTAPRALPSLPPPPVPDADPWTAFYDACCYWAQVVRASEAAGAVATVSAAQNDTGVLR